MSIFRNVLSRKEQRRTERHQVQYLASIELDDGKPPRTCLISDISDDGARLTVGLQTELPDEFVLLLRRRCRVVRNGQGQVGVQFVKQRPTADPR
jgi:hypothetical protein